MDELIKFRVYSMDGEKVDTITIDPKKDISINKKKRLLDKELTVTIRGSLADFFKNKVK